MALEVFNRHEIKFLVNNEKYNTLQYRLKEYMELDEFNKNYGFYTISNIYYDTDDNYLIRNSNSKPAYKEKLRVRSYGTEKTVDKKVYIEIKKKFNGIVNKRRTSMKLNEAYGFLQTGIKPNLEPYMNAQVLNEIEYFVKLYNVIPKLFLSYDRNAYFGINQRDLRITFDTNIRTRRENLKFEYGNYGNLLLPNGYYLMEVKAEKTIPLWLSNLLSEMNIFKTSFSKYGVEYNQMLQKSAKGEREICLIPSLPQLITRQSALAM